VAVIEFSVGLYILTLNVWHNANRHVGALLILYAINTVSIGLLMTATSIEEATPAVIIQAMTTPACQIGLLIVSAVVLMPHIIQGRRLWAWAPIYLLAFLPAVLTVLDVNLGTGLWFTGLKTEFTFGAAIVTGDFANGRIAVPLRILFPILPLISLTIAIYVAAFRKGTSAATRQLAWLLFVGLLIGTGVQVGLGTGGPLTPSEAALISGTLFTAIFAYAGFRQMVSERRLQRGNLQTRLVLIVLAVAVPLLIAAVAFTSLQAEAKLNTSANEQLRLANQSLKSNVDIWLNLNTLTVQQMAAQPDMVSMDPALQQPILVATQKAYPYLFLVHTTDLNGKNVARNDNGRLQDYSDRKWFLGSRSGARITLEATISRTSGRPVVNMGTPIKDASGNIVGVADINSQLDEIAKQVAVSKVGKTGVAYVIEPGNRVVAHPDPAYTTTELRDLSASPPVQALRQGKVGQPFTFTDEQGVRWHAYLDKLDNEWDKDWGIIVQQQESELLETVREIQNLAWAVVLLGTVLLAVMIGFAMRQALQPIGVLTTTATAIAAGNLDRTAPVESEDEIGTLAQSFNTMTGRLRDLIGGLEQRVVERTADLERRSRYLQASTEVGRAAASTLDTDQLIRQAVDLIRERFELYYVGLFLVDEKGEWAVLHAGTGTAGQAMLARNHKLQIGGGSMIGWSLSNAQPRIAQVAAQDAVRLATAELPETRSEAALPLRSRGQVIGALTVQSSQPSAFDQAELSILQIMADQVAVAIDNARLFQTSQAAAESARRAYGGLAQRAWSELLRAGQDVGFYSTGRAVTPTQGDWQPEMIQAAQTGRSVTGNGTGEPALAIPLKVRDQVIGVLDLRKDSPDKTWTDEEKRLVEALAEQLGVALESARLYEDTQRGAARERLSAQVTAHMRETLDVDAVLQTAVREISAALGLVALDVRLGAEAETTQDGVPSLSEP
jgi:GAF domain-containing protein/HAMP domain-containing protein